MNIMKIKEPNAVDKEQLLTDEQMQRFIVDGYITLKADFSGTFHQDLCQAIDHVFAEEQNPGNNILPRLPQIQQAFDHPTVHGALTSILGPNYLMNPHRHCHLNPSGSPVQKWHKDNYVFDQLIRHPRPRWVLAFYYPQDVTEDMGPTGIIPGKQYHHHISNPNADKTVETSLPICGPAGTVAIVHYDSWHRATANISNKNRYMLKFLFERMEEPQEPTWNCADSHWQPFEHDSLQPVNADVWHWLAGHKRSPVWNGYHGAGSEQPGPENGALRQLMTALADQDETVRLNTAYTLSTQGISLVPQLIDILRKEAVAFAEQISIRMPSNIRGDNPATCAAAHTLSAIGQPATLPLVELLEDEHWCVRTMAADTLGNIGLPVPEAVPILTKLLRDGHHRVRRHAAETLGRMETTAIDAIPGLINIIRDENVCVRHNACLALAKIGQPVNEAIPPLIDTLTDEDRYVRHFASLALRRIGTPEALEALMDALFTSRWCPITTTENLY